jgi:sugar lactone lactonase YvrE
MRALVLAVVALLAACATGRAQSAGPSRGPAEVVALDFDPNGLAWDGSQRRLYIADGAQDRVMVWTGTGAPSVFASLPAGIEGRPGFGALAPAPDGSLITVRFGFGATGGVFRIARDATVTPVAGIDPARRRIGVAVSGTGAIAETYFVVVGKDQRTGGVALISSDGEGTPIVSDLKKPVGVAWLGADLWVTDQDAGQVLEISPGGSKEHVAEVPGADLLCPDPNGGAFVASKGGRVVHVDRGGATSMIVDGLSEPRGIAFDPTGRRLFIAEHRARRLRIVAVP